MSPGHDEASFNGAYRSNHEAYIIHYSSMHVQDIVVIPINQQTSSLAPRSRCLASRLDRNKNSPQQILQFYSIFIYVTDHKRKENNIMSLKRGLTSLAVRVCRAESTMTSSTSWAQSCGVSTSRYFSQENNNHRVTDVVAAAGVPSLRHGRKVTIYAPPKTAMQSGSSQTLQGGAPAWKLVLEIDPKWANPLLGWTSTADAVETMTRQLQFFTKEDAIAYCTKNGIAYEVEEPVVVNKKRPKRFQGYGANFDVKRLKGGTPIGGLRSERQ